MWVPPEEKDPIVLQKPTRKSVSLFGAVNLKKGKLITMFAPQFDSITFCSFLKLLNRHRRKNVKTVVILDNARYHHTQNIENILKNKKRFKLDFLPPYSPKLNPIERVWKLLRKLSTHNQYFDNLDDLIKAVSKQLEIWKKPNDILRKLCRIN